MRPWEWVTITYFLVLKFVTSKPEISNLELHPSRLKIVTLDEDGVPSYDNTKFTVTTDGILYTFRLNSGVSCTEIKYDESTLWKMEENDHKHPKSVLFSIYNNTITLEMSNNTNLVYNYDPVHKIFYSESDRHIPSFNFTSNLPDKKQKETRVDEIFTTPTQRLSPPRAYCQESSGSDLENATPIVIDITNIGSAYEFDYFKSGKNSIFSAKQGFSFKLVKKSKDIIWQSSKMGDCANKVNVLDTGKGLVVTVYLSYEKTRQFYKYCNQWVEKGLIVIDINKTESTGSFHYSKYKNYNTYIAKHNFFISSVKQGGSFLSQDISIFHAKDESEYLDRVMVSSCGKMTLYFANGNVKHMYKKGYNQWYERRPEVKLDINTKKSEYEFGYSEDNYVGTYTPRHNFDFKEVTDGKNVVFRTTVNEYIEKVVTDCLGTLSRTKNLSIYFSNGDVKFFHRSGDEWTRRPSEITLNIKKKEGTFEYDCFNKNNIYVFVPKHNFIFRRIVQGEGNLVDIWVSTDHDFCNKVVLSYVENGKNLSIHLIDGNYKSFYKDSSDNLWVESSKVDSVIRERVVTLDIVNTESTNEYHFYFDGRTNAGVFMSREGYLFNRVKQGSTFSNTVILWETNNSSIFSNRVVVFDVYQQEVVLDIYLVNGNKLHFDIKSDISFDKKSWLERKSYLPLSEHPQSVTVLLMDPTNPNNIVTNDITKYVVSVNKLNDVRPNFPDKVSYDYRFKDDAKCVEFKVDNKTVWKYDPDTHESFPISVYVHKFMKLAFVEFNLHSLDIYMYVDGEWKLGYNNKMKGIKIDIQAMKSTNEYYFYIDEETSTGIYVPLKGYFFRKVMQSGSWCSPTIKIWETFHYYKYSNAIVVYNVDKLRSTIVIHHITGEKSYLSVEMNYDLISVFETKTYNLHALQYPENISVLTENNEMDYLVYMTILYKTSNPKREIYEYLFKGAKCLEFKIDDKLVWKYYSSEDRFPKSIYYHKDVEIVLVEFNNHSFNMYKYSENRWKMKSMVSTFSDRIIISTLDATGNIVENDTSKYNVDKSDKHITRFIFSDDARCVGLNYRNHTIWQYEGGDYPKVFYVHNCFTSLIIEFSNDYFFFYRYCLSEKRLKFELLRNIRQVNYEKIRLITEGSDYQVKRYDFAYEFQFKEGCRCLEFLYDEKTLWKYGAETPLLIYFMSNFDLLVASRNETRYVLNSKIRWKMPTPSELDIKQPYSNKNFDYFYEGDVGTYMSKPNHSSNIVKYGSDILWEASDPTLFVNKVVVNGVQTSVKNIDIFLNNNEVKHLHKVKGKWVSETSIVLDIDINRDNDLFEYRSTRNFGHFNPKPNLTIEKIVKKDLDIWTAKPNDHGLKAVLMGSGWNEKHLSILLQSGNFVLLRKSGKGEPWEDITNEKSDFSGIKMYSLEEGTSNYHLLTENDYDPIIFESRCGYEFKDSVNCMMITYNNTLLWSHTDDPEFGYLKGLYLDLPKDQFSVTNLKDQTKQLTKVKIVLDIQKTKSTSEFDYSYKNGVVTYTTKDDYVFKMVVMKDLEIWTAKPDDHGLKVVLMGSGKDEEIHLAVLLQNGKFVLLRKCGKGVNWTDITSDRHDITKLKFLDENKVLTSSDFTVSFVDFSYEFTFKDGVNCKKITYNNKLLWYHTDDPKFGYLKGLYLGLVSNRFFVKNQSNEVKKIEENSETKPVMATVITTPVTKPAITPVTLDISKAQSTNIFDYSTMDDFGTYKPKDGYAINVVKYGSDILWEVSDPTLFVNKVVVNGVRLLSLNDVKLYLVNGDVKRIIKVNRRWIDKETPLVLNISAQADSNFFNYNNNSDRITFTPKHELFINRVMENDQIVWETNKTIEYATKVTLNASDSRHKVLTIQMVRGDEVVFNNYGSHNKWVKEGYEDDNKSDNPEASGSDVFSEQKMVTVTYPEIPNVQHYQINQIPSNDNLHIQAKDRFDNWYNYTSTNLALRTNTPNTTQVGSD
uniref:SfiI-subtelomeric related protein family member, putative n=1 Tax=Theileria annulata TaxID=5874 RepID=A0A3B0N5G4_THEAN